MFAKIPAAAPDPILGLADTFNRDPRNDKLNLTVGVYCDESGRTPVFKCVKEAERRLLETEDSKAYLPIAGSAAFARQVQDLVFRQSTTELQPRIAVADTPGGTGALTVAARVLWVAEQGATVWISEPTWPNHRAVFAEAGLDVSTYRYYDADSASVSFDRMIGDLARIQPGDAVVLHGCCHNPTGADLTETQWEQTASLLSDRGAVAILDNAYIGLGDGIEADTAAARLLAASGIDLFVCLSFSKNMGLYAERVGGLLTVAADSSVRDQVQSRVKASVRSIYSNPPKHGGELVPMILGDAGLRETWLQELSKMRDRINGLRSELADEITRQGIDRCQGVRDGRGMFCLTGLTRDEVLRLRDESAVYLVENGRMNIAALPIEAIPVFVEALARLG